MAKNVPVRGHIRNGRPVRPHVRSAPGKRSTSGGAEIFGVAVAVVFVLAVIWAISHSSTTTTTPTETKAWTSPAGLTFTQVDSSTATPCSAHAYGAVRGFLAEHPCSALSRALYEAADSQGHRMLVAASWSDMASHDLAAQLRGRIDKPDAGNFTELSKEDGKYPGTRFTATYYASDVADRTAVIAQAEPLAGQPSADLLRQAVQQALKAPRP